MAKSITQVIDEQVRLWTQHQATLQRRDQTPLHWPIMTISREFGARGKALAEVVGRRLGFQVWDSDLVHAIAESAGGDDAMLRSLDERRRQAVDDLVHGTLKRTASNIHHLRALMRVIHTIEAHGKSIIVGRGANYIADADETMRVRVVCPLAERVRGYAERQHLDERQAHRLVVERDTERADFVHHHFRRDIAEPSDYDLVLNSGSYSLEQLADIVLLAYEIKVGRRPERVDTAD